MKALTGQRTPKEQRLSLELSDSFQRQNFSCRRTIAGTTDAPWSLKILNSKPQPLVEFYYSRRGLIREHDRPGMPGEPFGRSHLVVPGETSRTVGGELNVIRRVSVDEGVRVIRQRLEIAAGK